MVMKNYGSQDDVDDASKWEQLYAQGEVRRQVMLGQSEELQAHSSIVSPVRVVSFDLDNCLWRTSAVIDGANNALAEHLTNEGIKQPVRTEIVMRELFKANKAKYAPLLGDEAQSPVQLTQLRQDALAQILQEHNGYDPAEATTKAAEYFDVWTNARHAAIESHMATNVVKTLSRIRQALQTNDDTAVIMGAITDGNSDPTRLGFLRPFFDFCVNAESVGVSKPDPRVYMEAIKQVVSTHFNDDDSIYKITEDKVGPWWIHVGDDFVKDIVAGKGIGMRTVWARELIKEKLAQQSEKTLDASKETERSVQDFVKQLSAQKVIQMQVGAEDYLAESLQSEFADAIIDSFDDLADVLITWHANGLEVGQKFVEANDSALEVFIPDGMNAAASPVTNASTSSTKSTADTKFCVFCGEKLPRAAKFCSSCGEAQPALP